MPKLRKNRAKAEQTRRPVRANTRVDEACRARSRRRKFAKFDETVDLAVRLGVNPKHADQMVRGAIVLPHGTGQDRPRPRLRQGREGARGPRGRRRFRRKRRHGGEGLRRVHGLRSRDRDARHDGRRRQARSHPRSARPHAEPQGRHGDVRRGQRGARKRRAARSSTASRRRASSTPASARCSFTEQALADNATALISALVRAEALDGQGDLPPEHHGLSTMGPGVQDRPGRIHGRDGGGVDHGTRSQRPRRSARSRARFDKMTAAVFLDFKGMTVEHVDQAPRRVPQGRRRVQGRQEHARQARAQGRTGYGGKLDDGARRA